MAGRAVRPRAIPHEPFCHAFADLAGFQRQRGPPAPARSRAMLSPRGRLAREGTRAAALLTTSAVVGMLCPGTAFALCRPRPRGDGRGPAGRHPVRRRQRRRRPVRPGATRPRGGRMDRNPGHPGPAPASRLARGRPYGYPLATQRRSAPEDVASERRCPARRLGIGGHRRLEPIWNSGDGHTPNEGVRRGGYLPDGCFFNFGAVGIGRLDDKSGTTTCLRVCQ